VWTAVRAKLRDDDVLLANMRFTGRQDGDWEVDLILLLPDVGFATIEVKGGRVWWQDAQWHQQTAEGIKVIDLADQAVSEKYLVRRWLEQHPRWTGGRPRMAHFVALPQQQVRDDTELGPGLPRNRVIDKDQIKDAASIVREVLSRPIGNEPDRAPGPDLTDLAVEILAGRGDPQRDLANLRDVRDDHVTHLTHEQYRVLSYAQGMPRFQVVGGPGTGKTFLAMEQARRWAEQGLRVGFVAYSRGLTTWVRRTVDRWPEKVRGRVDVRTFHSLGREWGAVPDEAGDQRHWDEEIPAQMAALAVDLPEAQRYDALVIDEGQDFGAAWWPAVLGALRDHDHGHLAVFSDAAQQVFGRDGVGDLGLPALTLVENLRNAEAIGQVVNALMPGSMRLLGGAGPAVRLVACPSGEVVARADDEAVALLDAGWATGDVALLTTHHRHPMQVEAVEGHGREAFWDLFWDDSELFYSTVTGFKGLERPAVVLAVDGFRDAGTARETLLVGLSRARDLLVVVGDPDEIVAAGNKELAKRLGLR
jgi:hypothetical protein